MKKIILKYCIMVTGPAYGNQRSSSAQQFAFTLLKSGHIINSIFFYQEGVTNANKFTFPASDEVDLIHSWEKLAKNYKIPLYVCISASLRRGIVDKSQSELFHTNGNNLHKSFILSSLHQLGIDVISCDRFIQF